MPMLLRYGNLKAYRTWLDKNLAVYQELALAETKDFSIDWVEVVFMAWYNAVPPLMQCGFQADVAALQGAIGLTQWDEDDGLADLWGRYSSGFAFCAHLKVNDLTRFMRQAHDAS